jgi:beta-1,4-mannosyl-glycoprotein beta-1,4-N-acetylglucosaminyltransferase
MLYLHLATLTTYVDWFIIGYSNISFTGNPTPPVTFAPFEPEIAAYSAFTYFLYIPLVSLQLADSLYRNGTEWKREATARNYLIEGVRRFEPRADDLVLLCDVDEIATRQAIGLVRESPPEHYYNLCGLLFHYSYRWAVGKWLRPLVIRYGALEGRLDDYKFLPFVCKLPGVLHYHCSFCFPTIEDIIEKLRSFSHVEYCDENFTNPNYIMARISCGYGVLPPRWRMPARLRKRVFAADQIFLPDDPRLKFLKQQIGFTDLGKHRFSQEKMYEFLPKGCRNRLHGRMIEIKQVD